LNRRAACALATLGLVLASADRAAAQQHTPVPRLLPEMVKLAALVGRGETGDHREHFSPGLLQSRAIFEINRAILFQAATFPLGPTATLVTTRETGSVPRLFASGYTDTAFSLGRKRLLVSMSYQSTTFAKSDGLDLRDSSIRLYLPHAALTGDVSDRDLLQETVSIRLNQKVAAFSLAYGFGSRFDVAVVVPIVQMASDVRVQSLVFRTASAQTPAVHEYNNLDGASRVNARYCQDNPDIPGDTDLLECQGYSRARGVGDLVLRGKATLAQNSGALAVSVDIRLPTGNADELIGLGATQVKPAVVWSVDAGRIGARARAEYTWSNGSLTSMLAEDVADIDLDVPDELGLGLGVDVDIARRTTVSVDVLGRRLTNIRQFSTGTVTFASRGPGPLPSAPFSADDALIAGDPRDVTQVTAVLGMRFDLGGGVTAHASALVATGSTGLRPQPTAVFSLTKRY
jgi:hypothetical protein